MIKHLYSVAKALLVQYKFILLYLVFGGLTTVINLCVYALFYQVIGVQNVPSTAIAWVVAVAFAFVTNKLFVFESKKAKPAQVLVELVGFFAARLFTGVLDVAFMYVTVTMFGAAGVVMKLISNIISTVINYFTSKLLVFQKKE